MGWIKGEGDMVVPERLSRPWRSTRFAVPMNESVLEGERMRMVGDDNAGRFRRDASEDVRGK